MQAAGFFLFASAYWALLPVLARSQLHGDPTLYGVLLGAIGAGGGRGRLSAAEAEGKMGAKRNGRSGRTRDRNCARPFRARTECPDCNSACLLAGLSWIAVLATLNASAQVALPEWVRGRGLAAYVTVFLARSASVAWFGALSLIASGCRPRTSSQGQARCLQYGVPGTRSYIPAQKRTSRPQCTGRHLCSATAVEDEAVSGAGSTARIPGGG